MAKTYTFTDLAAPTGLAATLVAGTGYAAGQTRYYVVQAIHYSGTVVNSDDYRSLSSSEVTATTTAGNGIIRLTWNQVPGAGGYRIWKSTSSGGYGYMSNIAIQDSSAVGGVLTWDDNNSIGVAGNTSYSNTAHGIITMSGETNDVFTTDNIYQASVSGGWGVINKTNNLQYVFDCWISFSSETQWIDTLVEIIINGSWLNCGNIHFTLGAYNATTDYTYNGGTITFRDTTLNNPVYKELNLYDTVIQYQNPILSFVTGNLPLKYITFLKGNIIDSTARRCRYFEGSVTADCILKRCTLSNGDVALGYGRATLSDVFIQFYSRIFQTNTGINIRGVGIVGRNLSFGTVLCLGNDWTVTLVDSEESTASYYSGTARNSWIRDYKTVLLTVVNTAGVALVGASVKIYDKNNTLIMDATTNASGQVTQEIYYRETTFSSAGVKTITLFNPFKFEISLAGYQKFVKSMNITDKVTETISLEKIPTASYIINAIQ